MSKIFINLPVINLQKATDFYKALWFKQNMDFSNTDASAMVYDDNLSVMLLTHDFFQKFLGYKTISFASTTTEVLNALQFESRNEVDDFFNKAIQAGGKKTIDTYDHGFMYGRDFEDIDGHIWEAFWMDISQIPKE